jgi:hypothetical protein
VCGATLVFIGLPKIPEPPLPLHAPVGQTGGQRWKIRGSNGRAARLGLGGFLRSCGRGRFPLALGVWVWSGPAACRAVPLRLGVGGRRAWSERGAFCGPHGVLAFWGSVLLFLSRGTRLLQKAIRKGRAVVVCWRSERD